MKQCRLYSKIFQLDKQLTCTHCGSYMAMDSQFKSVIPPLHFKQQVINKTQSLLFFHSQCLAKWQ